MQRRTAATALVAVALALMLAVLVPGSARPAAKAPIAFTILNTNDFHGQLQPSGSNPGLARVAAVVNAIRASKPPGSVLLTDSGDEMQGSLLSNLQKGAPTIAAFNATGYNVATFGNHEFDWGQQNLADRTGQATYPFVTANIVKNDTGNCATAGWTKPDFASAPYTVLTANGVKIAFIGVTTQETPTITIASATEGLCFKDPTAAIEHYYADMQANADVIVVLSHLGYTDGGYGYGLPVYGDQTLAKNLNSDGKPVALIIGGHSHTDLKTPTTVGKTTITQSSYNGRVVGEEDLTFDPGSKAVTVAWTRNPVVFNLGTLAAAVTPADTSISVAESAADGPGATPFDITIDNETMTVTSRTGSSSPFTYQVSRTSPSSHAAKAAVTLLPVDATVKGVIDTYANDPNYIALVNQPIGYSAVDLPRNGGTTDNMMGSFVDDAIYNYLNTDGTPSNDVDVFLNNAGGIRTDWCYVGGNWVNTGCTGGTHTPGLLTYGNMFTILPFGNATVVGKMTGAQLLQVLNQAPLVSNGVIQPAGLKFKYFKYADTLAPGSTASPYTWAWGAFDYTIYDKASKTYVPLQMDKTYSVGTNEFLAPAGGDGYAGFKYMTDITYWGDMLNAVDAYVSTHYGDAAHAYMGPNGDGTLDNRIVRDGNDAGGSIVPITILHNNDSHGNLAKGQYVGYTQLASLINQERAHNPNGTLLLNAGDQIQGDAMMYYFKSAPSGFASDGTPLPTELQTHPMMAVMNALGYDAMTLGNHEFNFGSSVFKLVMGQAKFAVLGANVSDNGQYGLSAADGGKGVKPYAEFVKNGVKIAVVGITNHRVPNYELPSNIKGLTFSDPIAAAKTQAAALRSKDDVVLALTHIGFTEDPKSVEVDKNVDTNLAAQVPGLDAIIGGHSHTSPVTAFGSYKFLPTIVPGPDNAPVLVTQAYRYNNYLGEVVLGLRAKAGGGYEVVSRAGRYFAVTNSTPATPEDPAIKAIVDPYAAQLATYNDKVVGQTTTPIDTTKAFTEETNGANLQADAAVWELNQHGIKPDIHLSGAMTNKLMAQGATEASPVTLKISDMFAGMPYENSLVTLKMNGPQLKAVLERAYRNYYFYKYVPGYGGYSYYTTCMIDTNSIGKIMYRDTYPAQPDGNNVAALVIGGKAVDFGNATKYYLVSTVNYLAAGSCNFNDGGKSLWPLDQIVNDTQYYVRDAVIDYMQAKGTVSPKIEGRLVFRSPSVATLKAWVSDFAATGLITKDGIASALTSKLTAIQASVDAGNKTDALGQLNAFINSIEAQTGKAINAQAASILIADAKAVIATLTA